MSNIVQDLVKKLYDANNAYRDGKPYLSDAEFDILEEQLRIIDPNNEWFAKGVNDVTPKKRKVKLTYPMMSLNKHKTIDSLLAWASKYPDATFIITPKFDGLSVGIKGDVSWTRGDGTIGQDCTKQLMHTVKPNLSENTVIRGEIIFTNKNWEKFKELHPEAASSRNSATGLINGDFDVNRLHEYGLLSIMPYEIINHDFSKESQLRSLSSDVYYKVFNINQLNDDFLLNLFLTWKTEYPIDGLVIDVNEVQYRNGTEANGNPTYSVAYKSPKFSESATGVIKEIELNVNRYGIVTPVAILENPVFLSGAQINRVSAINMNYVMLWGIVPGEKVQIIRSGEVIPKIIGVGNVIIPFRETYEKVGNYLADYNENATKRLFEMKETNVEFPDYLKVCPHCGTPLQMLTNEIAEWCEMYCPNEKCYGRNIETAIKFFTIAQIDGFGDKKIAQIANDFIDSNIPPFFKILDVNADYLLGLEGWAETSANAFVNECVKIKTQLPFARFLHATGWFGELGEKTLQKIIDADGWDATIEDLVKIEGVQTKTALVFCEGKKQYIQYESLVESMFKFAYIKTSDVVKDGPLSKLNVCMTGFRDKMLASQISELGGNVLDSLTKNVNCLITKDKSSTSSKITKAQKMGIEVVDIQEFKLKYL